MAHLRVANSKLIYNMIKTVGYQSH